MERLVCVFKKMVQGESWLLPSTVPEERETACDRQVWSVARCTLTWYRENSPDFIIVCIKKSLLILQLLSFAVLLNTYFIFQIP